ncbi:hypothetical protein BB8028_0001g02530 [Beauveria bassiana]|uniref:Uncharacterized protein n=1 Tax=Beauveria bassiana TaxID=176275 RepID=A0A2S7XWL3_BEABA|nr:hypothetical protein BB8028_0001g02530 [Beauveria bassiana]
MAKARSKTLIGNLAPSESYRATNGVQDIEKVSRFPVPAQTNKLHVERKELPDQCGSDRSRLAKKPVRSAPRRLEFPKATVIMLRGS